MAKSRTSEPLPKTARGRRIITFRQCRPNCRCGRDPQGGPYFIRRWRERGRREETCVPWQEVVATCNALERERATKPENDVLLPKRAVGSLHLEFKRCGRPNCRCLRGVLHGPYVYRHRREAGRQKKEYVPMRRLSEVELEMKRQRAEVIRPGEIRRALKKLKNV